MASQNLFEKHARNLIYVINLNETGYTVFFLTEMIYEKICLKKGLILGNLLFKFVFFSGKKTERSPNLRFIAHNKCIGMILPDFLSSSFSHD